MKVRNMKSSRGNTVPNQFIITDDYGRETFQSYNTVIAFQGGDGLVLDKDSWNYSVTTSRYRNQFTSLNTKQTIEGIESGNIKLADLN